MLIAVDLGKVRTGVAVSDPSESFALPSATLTSGNDLVSKIARIAESHGKKLSAIVVGLPLHADGTTSPAATDAIAFQKELESAVSVPVVLFDERRTTKAAHATLANDGIKDKHKIDEVAAQAILASYIAALFGSNREEGPTLAQIKEQSLLHEIPFVRLQTIRTIASVLRESKAETVLEIGTALGYSAAFLSYCLPFMRIDTLENDKGRYKHAAENLAPLHRITCLNESAFEWKADKVYDAVFMDGPKSRLAEMLDKYWKSVKVGGFVFVDNTKLNEVRNSPYANTDRQRVRLIERMDDFVSGLKEPRADRKVVIHDFDDGLAVIEKIA